MGGDENSTQDMNQFIDHIDALLRHPHKSSILLVHHSGKASPGQARGSTALRGALDAEYQIEMDPTSKSITMENRKMKDGEVPAQKSFNIRQIGLGKYGSDGSEIMGASLETVDISGLINNIKNKNENLTKNQRVIMNSLIRITAGNNNEITIDDWREASADAGIARNRFHEAKDALLAKRIISISTIGIVNIIENE
jgi:hypothetical protein